MLMDADGGNQRRLGVDLGYCDAPHWSPPPNNVIAFTARVPGGFDIYTYDLSATPPRLNRLTSGSDINEWPRWSPDGRHLAFASNRSGSFDIFTMDANGDHVRRLTKGGSNSSPFWSR
jgi:TolB protein